MRRSDRAITDTAQIYALMDRCTHCRLGFWDGSEVYIVPLNFGYIRQGEETTLYFHSAKEGRKVSLVEQVDTVGFELDTNYQLKPGETPCRYGAHYESIIGTGTISFVTDLAQKAQALQAIMYQATKNPQWDFTPEMMDAVCVFQVKVSKLSCKMRM